MTPTPIHILHGDKRLQATGGDRITTRGVVIGVTRKGYWIQDPQRDANTPGSHGLFVFDRRRQARVGSLVEVSGEVIQYRPDPNTRPTTQLVEQATRILAEQGPPIEPFWLTAERVLVRPAELAALLRRLEGMLVGVAAGATFVAPSNPFGDYVLLPRGANLARTQQGGVLIDPRLPERWLPGFRVLDYDAAPTVHVGAELLEPILGPLNFRAASYQIAAAGPVRVRQVEVQTLPTSLRNEGGRITVLTLNCFNLDPHKEDPNRVQDPDRDVDDDVADRRFTALGRAIARDAKCPAIVALQEIQDNDGAELSGAVDAASTFARLIAAIQRAGGPRYDWADIPPEADADGGQPGGNIRNAFLYDTARVQLEANTMQRLGVTEPAFEGSRKPLAARFRLVHGPGEVEVINVHLASKRHQNGLFEATQPGFDPRLDLRVQQVEVIGAHLAALRAEQVDYYVTGDFNDFEFSDTLRALIGEHSINLVETVPEPLRFDYNHRGMSQALMHGVVARRQLVGRTVEYEILHANALIGTKPGQQGEKPSDHAYVIARLELASGPQTDALGAASAASGLMSTRERRPLSS